MHYFILSILLLFTGFDVLAFTTPVGAIRLSFFVFLVAFICLSLNGVYKVDKSEASIIALLIFLMFVTSYFSYNVIRSLSYIVWFLVCYLLYFNVIKSMTKNMDPYLVLKVFRDIGRLQILACIMLRLYGVERPALLYYEPSYMILAMLPYIYFTIIQFRNEFKIFKGIDVFLLFALVYITMSANLLLAIAIVSVLGYLRMSLKPILFLFLSALVGYYFSHWYAQNYDDLLGVTFQKILESENYLASLLDRTGNRWPRTLIAFDAAKEYLWYGVGLGSFSDFSVDYNTHVDYASGFSWNEPRGLPASNVIIELLAEGGIFVFSAFFVFIALIFTRKSHSENGADLLIHWKKIVFIFFILLIFESNLLRPYFWAYLGVLSSFATIPSYPNHRRLN